MLEACKELLETIGLSFAEQISDTCCFLWCYQPKEPAALKKLKKQNKQEENKIESK